MRRCRRDIDWTSRHGRSADRDRHLPPHRHRGQHRALGAAARSDAAGPRRHDAPGRGGRRRAARRRSSYEPRGEGDSRFAVFAAGAATPWQRRRASARARSRVLAHAAPAQGPDRPCTPARPSFARATITATAVNRCARLRAARAWRADPAVAGDRTTWCATASPPGVSMAPRPGRASPARPDPAGADLPALAPDLPAEFPPLRSLDARPHNLPMQRSALIGREREIAEIRALLLRPDVGLVTLIGPGGTGKTRLARQVAAEVLDQFPDGAYFVGLAPIRDPDLVLPTIGQVLGVAMDGGRPPLETLEGVPARPRDAAGAGQPGAGPRRWGRSWSSCWRPRIGSSCWSPAASRCASPDEREYEVPPLSLPPRALPLDGADVVATLGQYEAIRLFVERAQAVRADFALTDANAAARGRALPSPRRPAAGDRAGRRPRPPAAAVGDAGPSGRADRRAVAAPADRRPARPAGAPADAAQHHRLELRPAGAGGAGAVPPAGRSSSAAARSRPAEAACMPAILGARLRTRPTTVLDGVDSLLGKSLLRQVDGRRR